MTVEERMNGGEPRSRWPRRLGRAALALVLLAIGAAAGAAWSERRAAAIRAATPATPPGAATAPAPPGHVPVNPVPSAATASTEPVEVALTPDAMARIGLTTAVVRQAAGGEGLAVPATIMPNAYRDTKVNALVGGIVRTVSAELGSMVVPGQTLAVIGSQELAEAQTKYLSMRAMLEADHQKLRRTEKLVELGSASQQELEEITAVHVAHATEVAAARERLAILGLSGQQIERLTEAAQIVSEVVVAAPVGGAVTARAVNPGQVVMAGQEQFVVADLGTVWAVGEVYERDMAHVDRGRRPTLRRRQCRGACCEAGSPTSTRGSIRWHARPRCAWRSRTRVRICASECTSPCAWRWGRAARSCWSLGLRSSPSARRPSSICRWPAAKGDSWSAQSRSAPSWGMPSRS